MSKKKPFLVRCFGRWFKKDQSPHSNIAADIRGQTLAEPKDSHLQHDEPSVRGVDDPESTFVGSDKALSNPDLLKAVFDHPECSVLDGLNEYDDDFTNFVPRGTLLTHDMLREVKRRAGHPVDDGKTKLSMLEDGPEDVDNSVGGNDADSFDQAHGSEEQVDPNSGK